MTIKAAVQTAQNHFPHTQRRFLRRAALFAAWGERHAAGRPLILVLVAAAVVMGWLTFKEMGAGRAGAGDVGHLILLLNMDLVVLLALMMAIVRRAVLLWQAGKGALAGSELRARLAQLFTVMVAFPAIVTTVFSVGLFYWGIHGWFDSRVRAAVDESLAVAQAYLSEHQQIMRADVMAMATDLNRQSLLLAENPEALKEMLDTQSFLRNFSEVVVFDGDNNVLGQSGIVLSMMFAPLSPTMTSRAQVDDVIIESGDERLRALIKLDGFGDVYLYAGRAVDEKVIRHLDTTQAAVAQYQVLSEKSAALQVRITALYVVLVLLMVAIGVWFSMVLARRVVGPIDAMIDGAERLREGDMRARVPENMALTEFETLGRAFNRMAKEIERAQVELLEANRRLDYRRKFTETVLSGVSTGIMGVDHEGVITLANPAAGQLFKAPNDKLLGQKIQAVFGDDFVVGKKLEREVDVLRRDGARRRFLVRMSSELVGEGGQSTIIAFDDITDLVASQKSAAWADVARRIAHEIKNPLTPIQLSAERIKRKYLGMIADEKDRDILERSTDTIVRHVDDIKNMVNAFSNFAKMPDPLPTNIDLLPLVREVLSLQDLANSSIKFDLVDVTQGQNSIYADAQLVRQALINLVQNAVDALDDMADGKIAVWLGVDDGYVWVGVLDNGVGIPQGQREHILEPYVTTKTKGTGLGLAIVKKIAEDHGGEIRLDAPFELAQDIVALYKGASFFMSFPIKKG